ncbi:MAG: hypothetical protein PUA62_00640 [Lachnospiraceae bacterium]|nr:hypothetical protein [Lachnospiraceae bacterium]
MRRKHIYSLFLALLLVFGMCGCGAKEKETTEEIEANTIGTKFAKEFLNSDITDANAMVDVLLKQVKTPYDLTKMDVEEGYLAGFDEEIKGFTKGVKFSPVIGTIPFVGYVFETDDPDALYALLSDKANPAWNICTEADETVSETRGKLVFFIMCKNED